MTLTETDSQAYPSRARSLCLLVRGKQSTGCRSFGFCSFVVLQYYNRTIQSRESIVFPSGTSPLVAAEVGFAITKPRLHPALKGPIIKSLKTNVQQFEASPGSTTLRSPRAANSVPSPLSRHEARLRFSSPCQLCSAGPNAVSTAYATFATHAKRAAQPRHAACGAAER